MQDAPEVNRGCARPDGGHEGTSCDACGAATQSALARTVRLSVDRSEIDAQRLCPDCFAEWIQRYEREMTPSSDRDPDSEIIVD